MREVCFIDSLDDETQGEHYRTGEDFCAVLNSFSFPAPEMKTQKVDIPGSDGGIDLSTALTDGEPCFNERTGEITLILTGRNWRHRLDKLTNALHGKKFYISVPDDDWWYYGSVNISNPDPDINYCTVKIACICDPWKYAKDVNTTVFELSTTPLKKHIINRGRRKTVPAMTIAGNVDVTISDGSTTLNGLSGGNAYLLVEFPVPESGITLTLTGNTSGTAYISFREAIL